LTGFLSDKYGLPFALAAVPGFCVLAAAVLLMAARTYESDLKNIEGVEPVLANELNAQAA
jgi:hypothetical protein